MKSNQEKLDNNAEYQRRKVMSQDDRNRIAIDIGVKNITEENIRRGGGANEEAARRKMAEIAEKREREKNR
jgi:hypothetical protein